MSDSEAIMADPKPVFDVGILNMPGRYYIVLHSTKGDLILTPEQASKLKADLQWALDKLGKAVE